MLFVRKTFKLDYYIYLCCFKNNIYISFTVNEPKDVELRGKVLYCLKEKFRESKLEKKCENELANVLKEQALNYRLDPLLGKLCKAEIQTICAVPNDSITNSDGQVKTSD